MTAERPFAQRSASISERGVRSVNQDAALAVVLDSGSELLAVADGMGGHAAGEVASRRALESLQQAVHAGDGLEQAMHSANAAVLAEARSRPECEGMGTTLVALLRTGGEYVIANVGDSRAYRIDPHGIHQLTRDHSFVADAIRSGQLTAAEAGASPWRNAVTRAIGLEPDVEVDCYGPFPADEPHAIVLCTDGLYRVLGDRDIERILYAAEEPAEIARLLAGAAQEAGSDDNISLAVVRFGPGTAIPHRLPGPSGVVTVEAPAGAAADRTPAPERPPTGKNGADPPRRRSRPRRGRATRRWARFEVAAILLGVLAVLVYVFFLTTLL
jgi:PPM family protein phosphatase